MAYQELHAHLVAAGHIPSHHVLNNKASTAFQRAILANNCTFQLVPPHVHQQNVAEWTINTFKDHFLAILAGTMPFFPADRWDLLLPQAELTLNLLWPATDTAKPSA